MKMTRAEFLAMFGAVVTAPLFGRVEPIQDPEPLSADGMEYVEPVAFDPDDVELLFGDPPPLAWIEQITIDCESIRTHHDHGMVRFKQGEPTGTITGKTKGGQTVEFQTQNMNVVDRYYQQYERQPRGIAL